MELTEEHYEHIAPLLPVQRGNVRIPNLQVLNAILYVAEHGCKWRGLSLRFGRWHTIHARMNRRSKSGVLDQIFEHIRRRQLVRIRPKMVSMDSTIVKVTPTEPVRARKTARRPSESPVGDGPPGFIRSRGCPNGDDVPAVPRTGP